MNEQCPVGRKTAKRQREVDQVAKVSMESASYIAASLKRKAEIEEDKPSMKLLSSGPCDTAEDEREKAEYVRMMRRKYLRRAKERETKEEHNTENEDDQNDCNKSTEQGTSSK